MQQNEDMVLKRIPRDLPLDFGCVHCALFYSLSKNVLAEVEWHEASGVLQLKCVDEN